MMCWQVSDHRTRSPDDTAIQFHSKMDLNEALPYILQILFGGMTPTREYLRRYTGYVEQFDTLLPILTVEEMMMYTAELKRPMSESIASKRQAVEELVTALGLDVCRYNGRGRDSLYLGDAPKPLILSLAP